MAKKDCTRCHKKPIVIKKYKVCRACYAWMRRHGEISNAPELTELEIGKSIVHIIDEWRERLAKSQAAVNKEVAAQRELFNQVNSMAKENTKLKERIYELNEQLSSKKPRALKLHDLSKIVSPD